MLILDHVNLVVSNLTSQLTKGNSKHLLYLFLILGQLAKHTIYRQLHKSAFQLFISAGYQLLHLALSIRKLN